MIISFEGKLPQKLLILSSDCIEVTLDYCLWCLFLDTKNNKYGFSCLKFFVVAVGISVSLWINYLNIWNKLSENDFIEVNLTKVLWMHHIFENWKNSSEIG